MAAYLAFIVLLMFAGVVDRGANAPSAVRMLTGSEKFRFPLGEDGKTGDRTGEIADSANVAEEAAETRRSLLAAPSNVSTSPVAPAGRIALGLGDIDFRLYGNDSAQPMSAREVPGSGRKIEVAKPVTSAGKPLGTVTVTIDENARLFMKGSDLAGILPSEFARHPQLANETASGLVSFQRLRELGVDLRYDPVSDRIELVP